MADSREVVSFHPMYGSVFSTNSSIWASGTQGTGAISQAMALAMSGYEPLLGRRYLPNPLKAICSTCLKGRRPRCRVCFLCPIMSRALRPLRQAFGLSHGSKGHTMQSAIGNLRISKLLRSAQRHCHCQTTWVVAAWPDPAADPASSRNPAADPACSAQPWRVC